jgi:hypothetical protein
MAIDHAGSAAGDAVADASDLAELLGVDVDLYCSPFSKLWLR